MFNSPRHIVASVGGLITLQGLIFTAIEHNYFSLAVTLLGMLIVAGGLHVETIAAARQAKCNFASLFERVKISLRERAAQREELAAQREEKREIQRLQAEANTKIEASLPVVELEQPPAPRPKPRPQQRPVPVRVPEYNDHRTVVIVNEAPVMRWNPGIAAVLSFFIPGLGQLYKGQWFRAPFWSLFVVLGYCALIFPGVILHWCCILGALSGDPFRRR